MIDLTVSKVMVDMICVGVDGKDGSGDGWTQNENYERREVGDRRWFVKDIVDGRQKAEPSRKVDQLSRNLYMCITCAHFLAKSDY